MMEECVEARIVREFQEIVREFQEMVGDTGIEPVASSV